MVIFLISSIATLMAQHPSSDDILDKMEAISNIDNSKALMRQIIQTSTGKERAMEFESYSGNNGEKSLMRYTRPASVKGQAFLMLNNADDIWSYYTRTGRVRKLATHAKKQSVQGSDFTFEDMGGSDTWKEEFDSRTVKEVKLDGIKCWLLELVAKPETDQSYQKLLIWTDQETYYPVKIEYYDEMREHLKTLIMSDIRMVEDIPTAMKIVMTNHQKFTETRMEILEITYQWTPPKGFFSERSLKK